MMIQRPMKAPTLSPNLEDIRFPVIASIKFDGFRCYKANGQALTARGKRFPNRYIRQVIEDTCPDGYDGEIIAGKSFHETQSACACEGGSPNFKFHVFDYLKVYTSTPFKVRLSNLEVEHASTFRYQLLFYRKHVCRAVQFTCNSLERLQAFIELCHKANHEGVMIRDPYSPYKFGRSTDHEGFMFKLTETRTAEAVVIGFFEAQENQNYAETDAHGLTKRGHSKANMVPKGTLGAFECITLEEWERQGRQEAIMSNTPTFRVSTGSLTAEQRFAIWQIRESYLYKTLTYKCKPFGQLELPRHPRFKAWRNEIDMTEY